MAEAQSFIEAEYRVTSNEHWPTRWLRIRVPELALIREDDIRSYVRRSLEQAIGGHQVIELRTRHDPALREWQCDALIEEPPRGGALARRLSDSTA